MGIWGGQERLSVRSCVSSSGGWCLSTDQRGVRMLARGQLRDTSVPEGLRVGTEKGQCGWRGREAVEETQKQWVWGLVRTVAQDRGIWWLLCVPPQGSESRSEVTWLLPAGLAPGRLGERTFQSQGQKRDCPRDAGRGAGISRQLESLSCLWEGLWG